MSEAIEQKIIESLKQLPLQKQQEVLDFVEFLAQQTALPARDPKVIESIAGKYRHLKTSSEDDAREKQAERAY
ncbi:MAG: DUF2281 domain-containing protein [Acidobacteria bacterium]|nr:DUF2281 domain-containing protein [Acidobacteriota bacterium]